MRSSPAGFVLGILFELAAIVFAIWLIQRIDLEPLTSNPAHPDSSPTDQAFHWREPPPILTVDPARPRHIEDRLDLASQQLVNSLGAYAAQTAADIALAAPNSDPIAMQISQQPDPRLPTQGSRLPASSPRPWIRY